MRGVKNMFVHQASYGEKGPQTPPFKDPSALIATCASPSTPTSVGTKMSKRWRAETITLTAADTTIALRTEA
jgi:hypothetical protein